jgi:beta-galactosidase
MEIYMEKNLFFGVDYYPEHWPRERWAEDVRLMKKLGIQMVRMGEFSWHKFEPVNGRFEFAWLDEAIDLMGKNGILTVLGTPTAAPPAWMIEQHPDFLPVDEYGHVKAFGGRHHDCQSNPLYRWYASRIVGEMARHYRNNPFISGWQIDNELGNSHDSLCRCENCTRAFQRWLEERYGVIEEVNKAWGTAFWSQTYDKFEQIQAPRVTPNAHNPSLLLDWNRFHSDLIIDFAKQQVDIIREICPHHFITHNFMGIFPLINYYKLAELFDFVSNDQYPTGYYLPEDESPARLAAEMDFCRSLKKKNFWMLEMQAGATGGAVIGKTPEPGQLKLWTMNAIAHGTDAVVYFRWRTCAFGTEQFWHGILPHNGIPGKRYQEIGQCMNKMDSVYEDISGICTLAQVGILFDYDNLWAFTIQPQHPQLNYIEQCLTYYKAFFDQNIPVDFVRPEDAFDRYRLLVAPLTYLMDDTLAKKLEDFVRQGGSLVLTMRCGVKNRSNVCETRMPLPGRMLKVAGIEIADYNCLFRQADAELHFMKEEQGYRGCKWTDEIILNNAQCIAVYDTGLYPGKPAITVNRFGEGFCYYIGTEPDEKLAGRLMKDLAGRLELVSCGSADGNIRIFYREGRRKEYLFILNYGREIGKYHIEESWKGNEEYPSEVLSSYEVRIFSRDKDKVTIVEG